jgi:hypothetical protein
MPKLPKMVVIDRYPPKPRKTVTLAVPNCYIRRGFTLSSGTVVPQTIICRKKK